jgi:hypothetical protein
MAQLHLRTISQIGVSVEPRRLQQRQLRLILLRTCEADTEPDQSHIFSRSRKRLAQKQSELIERGRQPGAFDGCAGEIREF